MKLALGSVQFGLNYGIANKSGKVSRFEIEHILNLARQRGIDMLDTAIAYGDSESSLGVVGVNDFKVITKLPEIPDGVANVGAWVAEQVKGSLLRLKIKSVYALLLHQSNQLVGHSGEKIICALEQLKSDGVVQKMGVSIYAPTELDTVMQVCSVDIVQAPFNIIDRRLLNSGWLKRLHEQGVEIHARSTFLQGLLLMKKNEIPEKFRAWSSLFYTWHKWLEKNSVSSADACLSFIASHSFIDRTVVGVESRAQLEELLHFLSGLTNLQLPDLNCQDERLINPSNWKYL